MPTVLIDEYKFRFYSSDFREPPHVHIFRGEKQAKIWLDPIEVQTNYGYNQSELNKIIQLTKDNRDRLLEIWHDHFDQ